MNTGYAISPEADPEHIDIKTVSPTERAAKINWLVTACNVAVMQKDTDEQINKMFDMMVAMYKVKCRKVYIMNQPLTAKYTRPVEFTTTNNYGSGPKDEDDAYTVEEWLNCVKDGAFIDYDGHGHPCKDKMEDPDIWMSPSRPWQIPEDATHVIWYNR